MKTKHVQFTILHQALERAGVETEDDVTEQTSLLNDSQHVHVSRAVVIRSVLVILVFAAVLVVGVVCRFALISDQTHIADKNHTVNATDVFSLTTPNTYNRKQ